MWFYENFSIRYPRYPDIRSTVQGINYLSRYFQPHFALNGFCTLYFQWHGKQRVLSLKKEKDPNLDTKKCCASMECRCIYLNREANLMCSRCHAVFYCSRECQAADFKEHKSICKQISKAREKASALKVALGGGTIPPWDENNYRGFCNRRINYFDEEYLGDWWGHLDPRDYCRAVWKVSDLLRDLAWDYESQAVWEECLNLKLELLRNNVGDNQGIRDEVPAVMLNLNRDDDCVKFIVVLVKNLMLT